MKWIEKFSRKRRFGLGRRLCRSPVVVAWIRRSCWPLSFVSEDHDDLVVASIGCSSIFHLVFCRCEAYPSSTSYEVSHTSLTPRDLFNGWRKTSFAPPVILQKPESPVKISRSNDSSSPNDTQLVATVTSSIFQSSAYNSNSIARQTVRNNLIERAPIINFREFNLKLKLDQPYLAGASLFLSTEFDKLTSKSWN